MQIVEVEVDELPLHVGLALAQFGAGFKEGAVKKGFNEYGLDWLEVAGWSFCAVRAYLKLGLGGMDAVARGGSEIPAIQEYSFKPAKPTDEEAESEWIYVRTGLFKKEVSGVRWKGEGELASRLNADTSLQQKLLWINDILGGKGIFEKVFVEKGEVRFRFNTLMKRKGMFSTKRMFYYILPSQELFEVAESVCRTL